MRKAIILVAFLNVFCTSLDAQIKMQVTEIIVSKLKEGGFETKITNGRDTKIITSSLSGYKDTPYLEASILIENLSDSIIIFNPNKQSVVTLNYAIDSISVKKDLYSSFIKIDNDDILTNNHIFLKPNQKLTIACSDELFNEYLWYELETTDNTIHILKILPTMKFTVITENGRKITNCGILSVKVKKYPPDFQQYDFSEKFKGYWLVED